MKTIYLQRYLSMNGRGALGGRRLADRFREVSEDLMLGHMIWSEAQSASAGPSIRGDLISESEMLSLDPDVILLEGGLFESNQGGWRVSEAIAADFVDRGGIFIVADVDANTLRDQRQLYRDAVSFLGASASYRGGDPVSGYDEVSYWRGHRQILCDPADMVVSS